MKKVMAVISLLFLGSLLTGCSDLYIIKEQDVQKVTDKLYDDWYDYQDFECDIETLSDFINGVEDIDAEYAKEALNSIVRYVDEWYWNREHACDILYDLID